MKFIKLDDEYINLTFIKVFIFNDDEMIITINYKDKSECSYEYDDSDYYYEDKMYIVSILSRFSEV